MRLVQNEPDPNRWPGDLRTILVGVATAMARRPLTPDLIASLAALNEVKCALPEHTISISYKPRDQALRGDNSAYLISIDGPRLKGGWSYSHGQLANALLRCVRHADKT
jgi:hypothetical protein